MTEEPQGRSGEELYNEAREQRRNKPHTDPNGPRPTIETAPKAVTLDDFYAYMPRHTYIYTPTREPWPGASVNARIPPVVVGYDENGKEIKIPASAWLDEKKPVEQMTWAPGLPMIVRDRLVSSGGWIRAARCELLQSVPAAGDRARRCG